MVIQSLAHIALVVRDYDEAIAWFCGKLGFTLVVDEYQPVLDVLSEETSSGATFPSGRN